MIRVAVLIGVILVVLYSFKKPIQQSEALTVRFWEEKAFYDGLPKTKPEYQKIYGGIVPHHLVAGEIIADLFSRLSLQKPKTIILIGPNHYEVGNAPVISSDKDWQTVFGRVELDRKVIDSLKEKNLISFNDQVMLEEHSVQGSMPYIKYFTPKAKIVPLILSNTISKKQLEILADSLQDSVEDGAIVVASVDFSHHLSSDEADRRDVVTLEIMKNKDIEKLLALKSQNVDSPPSIALIMMLMEKIGHGDFTLDQHTNSGKMLGDKSQEVTSYIAGTFR
jgi:AmmeMemoRadiSam system protein B